MKKTLISLVILVFTAFSAFAMDIKENVHYKVVDRPLNKGANGEGMITEIFSVFCSYCYQYDKSVLPAIKAALPEGVEFNEMHLAEMGQFGATATKVLAVAASVSDGAYEAAKKAYFEAHFVNRTAYKDEAEFIDIGIKAAGISRADYDKLVDSPQVKAILDRWSESLQAVLVYGGTPAVMVNNRYIVIAAAAKSQEDFNNIVKELLKK